MDVQHSPAYQRIYSPTSETKLYIIIDSGMPIVTKVPVTPGSLTLGQFKTYASLNDNCYKFYFKSHDSEFGTVKEELVDDDTILPVEDGKIVVWVISNDTAQSALFRSESPYGRLAGDSLTYGNATPTPSTRNHDQPFRCSSLHNEHVYDQMITNGPPCVVANLYLEHSDSLGLTVLCPSDEVNDIGGLFIDKVQPSSVAFRDGRIAPGDRVVEVNGVDLRGIPASEAVIYFKKVVANKGAINLVLQKNDPDPRLHSPARNGPLPVISPKLQPPRSKTGFDPATELPVPIFEKGPTSRNIPHSINIRNNLMHGTTCSLPRSLTPRSLYTTSNLDNLTLSNDLRYPLDSRSVYEPRTSSSLRQISVALHCGKDSIDTIYANLKANSVSLDIKDRQWLKVVVKDAFLGSTLIKWLSRNVYGFCNRSEIKRYANKMLSIGLIKSPMSNAAFSEKCYYTLS